jgi:hypothetical protein
MQPATIRSVALRIDYQPFENANVVRLDSGGLRIPATLTRVGVFRYSNEDGSDRFEYRPAEEVLSARVMDQARGIPLTNDHPAERRVDAASFQELAIGHVGDDVRPHEDGVRMAATVYVQDAAAVQAVERGMLTEISLGYRVDFDPTPGEFEGQKYHGIQRNIRVNHAALVRRGRAGRDVGLRLDSQGDQIPERLAPVKIRIGGKEYEAGSPEAQAAIDALALRADSAEKAERATRAKATRERVISLKIDLGSLRADADENQVMIEALKKIAPDVPVDGTSPDYVAGAFAVALSILMRDAAVAKGAPAAAGAETEDTEGEEPEPAPQGTENADGLRRDRADALEREEDDREDADDAPKGSIAERAYLNMIARGASRRKDL